jgi:hypothetical protein
MLEAAKFFQDSRRKIFLPFQLHGIARREIKKKAPAALEESCVGLCGSEPQTLFASAGEPPASL